MTQVVWRAEDSTTTETCRITEGNDGVSVNSVIEGLGEACTYRLTANRHWEFRSLLVTLGARTLDVTYDGTLWRVNDDIRGDLRDAREVDISASPFSNTLPIRRLGLAIGDSADIVTAYVTLPALSVATDPQRYTRLDSTKYLYESRDSDFRREITVDSEGVVVDYPGLFRRADAR